MTTVLDDNVHNYAGKYLLPWTEYFSTLQKNKFYAPSIYQCEHCILYILVDGSSDDLDEPIKELFQDREFVKEHNLCSINSINWARILVQVRMEKFPCSTKWLLMNTQILK